MADSFLESLKTDFRHRDPSGHKLCCLKSFWQSLNSPCVIGFSGGVDSSFLLASAKRWARNDVSAYIAISCFLEPFDLFHAKRVCKEIGIELIQMYWRPLNYQEIIRNDCFRCYHCKRLMYSKIKDKASDYFGFSPIFLDGTQYDDLFRDRPGIRALQELGILTPLASFGFTKADIRDYLKKWGYSFWDYPSKSCLATRIRQGIRLSEALF